MRGSSSRPRCTRAPRRFSHAIRTRLRLFVPRLPRGKVIHDPGEPPDDAGEPDEASSPALIGFAAGGPGGGRGGAGLPRKVDPGVALVELDEVKVHAQAETGRKEILVFTALVMIAGRCWHLAAATTRDLAYQVGGIAHGPGGPSRDPSTARAGRSGAVDPGVVRGPGGARRDNDRVLVPRGEAMSARPEPGVPRPRAPQ